MDGLKLCFLLLVTVSAVSCQFGSEFFRRLFFPSFTRDPEPPPPSTWPTLRRPSYPNTRDPYSFRDNPANDRFYNGQGMTEVRPAYNSFNGGQQFSSRPRGTDPTARYAWQGPGRYEQTEMAAELSESPSSNFMPTSSPPDSFIENYRSMSEQNYRPPAGTMSGPRQNYQPPQFAPASEQRHRPAFNSPTTTARIQRRLSQLPPSFARRALQILKDYVAKTSSSSLSSSNINNLRTNSMSGNNGRTNINPQGVSHSIIDLSKVDSPAANLGHLQRSTGSHKPNGNSSPVDVSLSKKSEPTKSAQGIKPVTNAATDKLSVTNHLREQDIRPHDKSLQHSVKKSLHHEPEKLSAKDIPLTNALAGHFRQTNQVIRKPVKNMLNGDTNLPLEKSNKLNRKVSNSFEGKQESTLKPDQHSNTQSTMDSSNLHEAQNLNTDMLSSSAFQTTANEQLNSHEPEILTPILKSSNTAKMMDVSLNPNQQNLGIPSISSKHEVKIAPVETSNVNVQEYAGAQATTVTQTGASPPTVPMGIQTEVMNTNTKQRLEEQTVHEPVQDIFNGINPKHNQINALKSIQDTMHVNEKLNAQSSKTGSYTEKQNVQTGILSSQAVQNSENAQLVSSTSEVFSPKVQESNNVEMVGVSVGVDKFTSGNTEVSMKHGALLTPLQTNEVNGQHITDSQSTTFTQTGVSSSNVFSDMKETPIAKDSALKTGGNLKLQETVVDLTAKNQLQPNIDTMKASSAAAYKVDELQPQKEGMTENVLIHKDTASLRLNITPEKLDSNAKVSIKPSIVEENILSNQKSDTLTAGDMYSSINNPDITAEKNIPLEWQIQKHELQMLKTSTNNPYLSESVINLSKEPNALKTTISLGTTSPDTQEKVSQNSGSRPNSDHDTRVMLDLQSQQLPTTNTATNTIDAKATDIQTLDTNRKLSSSLSEPKVVVVSPEIPSEAFSEPLTPSGKKETSKSNINTRSKITAQTADIYESMPTVQSPELVTSSRKDRGDHESILVDINNSKNPNQLKTSDNLVSSINDKTPSSFGSTTEKHKTNLVDISIINSHPVVSPNTKELISASAVQRGQYETDISKNAAQTMDKPYVLNTETVKKPRTLNVSAVDMRKSIHPKTTDAKHNNINHSEQTMSISAHKSTSRQESRFDSSNMISTATGTNIPEFSGRELSSVQKQYPNSSPTASDKIVASSDGFEKKVKLLRMLVDTVLKIPAGSALESVLMNFIAHRRNNLNSQGSTGVSSQKPMEAYSVRVKERKLKQQPTLELISVSDRQETTRVTKDMDLSKPKSQTNRIDPFTNTGHQTQTEQSYELTNPNVKKTTNALPAYSIKSTDTAGVSQRQQNAIKTENQSRNNVSAIRSINGLKKSNVNVTVFPTRSGLDRSGSKHNFNRHAAHIQARFRNMLAAKARSTPEGKCVFRSICGTDGNVYLSNCFLPTSVSKACDGSCPCQQQPDTSVPPSQMYQKNLPNHIFSPQKATQMSRARPQPIGRKARIMARCMNKCPLYHDPVCSETGKTYENDCKRTCSGEKQVCVGPCPCEFENLTPQLKRLVRKLSRNPKTKLPIHRNAIEIPEPAELDPLPTSASPCPCPVTQKGLVCTSTGQTIMMCRARCQHVQILCFGRCPCKSLPGV